MRWLPVSKGRKKTSPLAISKVKKSCKASIEYLHQFKIVGQGEIEILVALVKGKPER